MSRKLVVQAGPIRWPDSCAMCGARDALVNANAKIDRITSVRPTLAGGMSIESRVTTLNYPVCPRHARGLAFATLLTQNGGGIGMLRTTSFLFGPLAILMVLAGLKRRLFGPHAANAADLPLAFVAMFAVFAGFFILVMLSYRRVPLRLIGLDKTSLTLVFRNGEYAAAFARLNAAQVRK